MTASQIEIHYNINPNDDILSKTQSAVNLYNIGMPEELILKYINLSLDPCADAQKWVDNVNKKKEEERKTAENNALNAVANAVNSESQDVQNEQIDPNNDKIAE